MPPSPKCSACGKSGDDTNKLLQCSVCVNTLYCSADCQRGDFPSHKATCKKFGLLSLFGAIQKNDKDKIQRLAKTKYVLNGRLDYTPTDWEDAHEMKQWTAMHECIRKDNTEAMKILIDSGAKMDIMDGDGETPTFVAATNSDPELIKILLGAGANPNPIAQDGWSGLMMSARDGLYENVKAFLEAGADLNVGRDMFGRGVLDIAEMQASGQGGVRMKDGETYEQAMEKYRRVHALFTEGM